MRIELPTTWPTTLEEAMAVQQQLRSQVITEDRLGDVRYVAGIDCGFEEDGTITRAAVAVLSFPDLALVDQSIARQPTTMPYVPGFLSFREVPAVLHALRALTTTPDLLLCDGQGLAHPRRFGLACHIGLLTGVPAIGVAKTLLVGRHGPLVDERGAWEPLVDRKEVIGAALRTRPGTKPLFISIGHKITLLTAIEYVMRCTTKYRLPETTRRAHGLASG
jgi:deoxyribonuclease V